MNVCEINEFSIQVNQSLEGDLAKYIIELGPSSRPKKENSNPEFSTCCLLFIYAMFPLIVARNSHKNWESEPFSSLLQFQIEC